MHSDMARVLVTGSAGFIGSHLVDRLIDMGNEVIGVDDLSGGTRNSINRASDFYELDLRDRFAVSDLVANSRAEVIYHLAADAAESRSPFTPLSSVDRNLNAYLNVLIPAIRSGFRKMVLVSSISVYGSQRPPFREHMPRRPNDIYGASKASMEEITEILSRVHDFKFSIVRLSNVYGRRQRLDDPYRNVVGIFVNRILMNKRFFVYGDGRQKRVFTHVSSITPTLAQIGFDRRTDGEVYNLGACKPVTIRELGRIVLASFGYDPDMPPDELSPVFIDERPNEVKIAFSATDKIRGIFPAICEVPLAQGVEDFVDWARAQGPQSPRYLDCLEIGPDLAPVTWRERLI